MVFNPKPNNLDRRFRIYRETLSRFSCAASFRRHFTISSYRDKHNSACPCFFML
ncbi:hypothetical protein ACTMNS_05260 [Staphylococcus haemolyticus]